MGCCSDTGYPKNSDIEQAVNNKDLVNALTNAQKHNNAEIKEIENHLLKGAELVSEFLKPCGDAALNERRKYLAELNESYKGLITAIEGCTDDLPLTKAKELLQKCVGNYYICYDQTKKYKLDEDEFIRFAVPYGRTK